MRDKLLFFSAPKNLFYKHQITKLISKPNKKTSPTNKIRLARSY